MLAHSVLIELSSKLLVTRTGIKVWASSILGLWFPWFIYMFFEMKGCQVRLVDDQKICLFNIVSVAKSDIVAHNSPRPFGFISFK